jgi:outer membrane protein assembly factor BamE
MKPYFLCLLPLLSAVAACSSSPGGGFLLSPYRIDVRQGNFVTQEMVSRLKPGQTRDQVRFILGSPLVTDVFHADRWDYVYRFQPGRGEPSERRLTVFFENNLLARVAGDVTSSSEPAERPVTRVIEIEKPVAEGAEKKAGTE